MAYPLDNAIFEWENGNEALRRREREGDLAGDEVTGRIREELRRRLGSSFTAAELADLYGAGTDWARELSGIDAADPALQDLVDAAFWQQLQNAADYAGGRRIEVD